jgi:probable F420-dependent oxidoreductase
MKFAAGFPLTASNDVASIREFAQRLDAAGFDVLTVSGHLLSVPAGRYADRPAPTYAGPFHDPFVLFGYLAAITQRLHFRPSILILPLYATAIVAKQAVELQLLSGGRFELGVGISWNPTEYRAVGQEFTNRGRRLEEQVHMLRRLWSEPFVQFDGRFHRFDEIGLNRVLEPPIPIWMGGTGEDRVLRRVARVGDGFIPLGDPAEIMPRLRQYLTEAGRDPSSFGLTGRVIAVSNGPEAWLQQARALQALGATHLGLSAPPDLDPAAGLERIIEAKQALERAL